MNVTGLINLIIEEWAYRVNDGMPDVKNPAHLKELGIVLSELGLSHIKEDLLENLITEKGKTPEKHVVEADKSFKSAILNKIIKYKNAKGEDKEGMVGNLLRQPKGTPARDAAERMLPPEGSPERDEINKDLGGEGQPTKPEDGKDAGASGEQPQEDPIKKAAAMYDPKVDPAMAARLDKEKETLAKLAGDKEDKGEEDKIDGDVDKDGNIKGTDIKAEPQLDQIPPKFREQVNTKLEDLLGEVEAEEKRAEEVVLKSMGLTSKDELTDANMDDFKDRMKKENKPPNLNLCKVTVPGTNLYCDENKGLKRDEMPQFKGKPVEGKPAAGMEADPKTGLVDIEGMYRDHLKEKGITISEPMEVPSESLKATQDELVGAQVVSMTKALDKDPKNPFITAPIYVSRDGYIVDGHHRWAAIMGYNMKNADNPIPMKVMVIDDDIDNVIPDAIQFADEQGIQRMSGKTAGKDLDNKQEPGRPDTEPAKDVLGEPAKLEPVGGDSNAQKFKGEISGKEIQTIELDGGQLYGTIHKNTKMVDDIVTQVKSTIPQEKWKDIVFVGEGGSTNDAGELEFNDEMVYAADKFKELGAGIDTFDGDELDVHEPNSKLYQKQLEKTGLNQSQVNAGNWASMIGQGEGTDTMQPSKFLDDEGKQFLQDAAKEAGFAPIENWDEPTEQDRNTLFRLSFPADEGDKETKVNDVQVAFNQIRDENLIEKSKELKSQGKIPITVAGEGHVDLVDKMTKSKEEIPSDEKLPEPKEPDETPGGKIYSIGGGYYSDTPNGPAQYRIVESVVEEVLLQGDETLAYLLFEAVVTKTTAKGKKIKVQTIDINKQKAATAKVRLANAEKQQPSVAEPSKEKESGRQELNSPKTEAEKQKMRAFTDKSVTSSLELTKSDTKAQEKQAKDEYEKAVKAWEKGGKKGPKPQYTKGLGAGSPESRAGESAIVKGALVMKTEYDKCVRKSKDKEECYLQAREIVRQKLETYLGPDSYLTKEWIDSAMNSIDLLHDEIGFDNIEEIGWDNQQGRALVGAQGHGTSADMFIKTKDGKRIGVSLKKDLKVFVFNGGYAKLEKVLTERGFKLSDKSTMEYYNKRRYEELQNIKKFAEKNSAEFCKDFDNLKKNPNRISSKPQNVQSRVSDILKKTGKSDLSKVKCSDFINGVINEKPTISVDSMKIIGDLCKTSTNTVLKDAYKKLRALDREMTEGIGNDFSKPENQKVVKQIVRDETHISDILFAENPNLDELKVVFGTEPAISMKPEKLAELFGIQKLHQQYLSEKDPKKKEALKKKMEAIIDSKIVINTKKGVLSVAITITDKNGEESQLPLFEAKIRTRGFGNSPTFEMPQTVFGGLAYKYGHTRYNEWDDDDKEIVVASAIKDIEDDFAEELEFLDDKTSTEILKRLKDLETIYPNSPSLSKFKKKYLSSNNKTVQAAKQKAKAKKKK